MHCGKISAISLRLLLSMCFFFFFFFFLELNLFYVEQILVYIDGADTWKYYTKVKGGNKGHIKGDKYVGEGGRSTG